MALLTESVAELKQHIHSHVSGQTGNFTDAPLNRTLTLPADDFDPLGGHTIWQVTSNCEFNRESLESWEIIDHNTHWCNLHYLNKTTPLQIRVSS